MKRRRFLQSSVAAAAAVSLFPTLLSGRAWADAMKSMTEVVDDISAVQGNGTSISLRGAAVRELSQSLRGHLLLPGNAAYEIARQVQNPVIDRHPALIIQPSGAADISNAVQFAADHSLLLAVKCGGHSWSGKSTCDGGMQIDLSSFRNVRVDTVARTAYAAGGSLLGELDHEAMAHGLVTTAGTVSHTGVGGLTLGGGFGRVARRFGLALDNVIGVDIITADGRLRHASAQENPDLYWAVRGGGGNFGVVTSFELQLHPMEREVIAGDVVYPLSQARAVARHYAEVASSAPDDLYVDFVMASPLGSSDGVCLLHACYSGPRDRAEQVLAPLRSLKPSLKDSLGPMDYVAVQRSGDTTDARTQGTYVKSGFVNEISETLVDAMVARFEPVPQRSTVMLFQHAGGAISRVPADATAFAQRNSLANMMLFVDWPAQSPAEEHVAWIKQAWAGLEPFTDGWYTNEISQESSRVVNRNYASNYPRLVTVKNRYDPGNLFRLNANIVPTV